MTKIIFFLWLLSGKVERGYDNLGYTNYEKGRKLYVMGKDSLLYKGEILNYIRTKNLIMNEKFSDKNGRITELPKPVRKLIYDGPDGSKEFLVYGNGKKQYIIHDYLKVKIFIYKK